MKNLKFSSIALVALLAMPIISWAQTDLKSETEQVKTKPCKQMCEKGGPAAPFMELNLTDEQKQKVEKLQLEHQKKGATTSQSVGREKCSSKDFNYR